MYSVYSLYNILHIHFLVFRWQFASDGADIGFGVYLKKKMGEWVKAGQMKEIVQNQRYNAHLVPEDGSLTCPEPGVCKYRRCFKKTNNTLS